MDDKDRRFARAFLADGVWGLFLGRPLDGWTDQLAAACAPRQPIEVPRRHCVAHEPGHEWRANAPAGCAVRRMDKSLPDLPGMEPPDEVRQMSDAIDWEASIARTGCGAVATRGDQIAAPGKAFANLNQPVERGQTSAPDLACGGFDVLPTRRRGKRSWSGSESGEGQRCPVSRTRDTREIKCYTN